MDIKKHYRKLLIEHGDSAESAQYSNRATQEKRLQILTDIAPLQNKKILDFGCGTGHLATYLAEQGTEIEYFGVDIVEDFFEFGRSKHPKHQFGLLKDFKDEKFDFAFVSGVFNNKMEDNRTFYQSTLIDLFSRVKQGIAFNMMSTYVDYQDDGLFYEEPEKAFSFIKNKLTPRVSLRHDYQVKAGVIPFEFAIYAYK